jgi:hypothetical protein
MHEASVGFRVEGWGGPKNSLIGVPTLQTADKSPVC